jgi:hypothetical protein
VVWGYRFPGDHTVVSRRVDRAQDRLADGSAPGLLVEGGPGTYRLEGTPG